MAIGDAWAVQIQYAVQGLKMSSTLHYLESADVTGPGRAVAIGDAFWLKMGTEWKAISGNNTTFECVYVRQVFPLGEENPGTQVLGAQSGVAGPNCPSNTAAILLVATSVGTSRQNNRIFWGCVGQDVVDGNSITAAAQSAQFDALQTKLREPLAASGGELVLAARIQPEIIDPQNPPPKTYNVSPFVAWRPTLKNQNSRRSKLTGLHTP